MTQWFESFIESGAALLATLGVNAGMIIIWITNFITKKVKEEGYIKKVLSKVEAEVNTLVDEKLNKAVEELEKKNEILLDKEANIRKASIKHNSENINKLLDKLPEIREGVEAEVEKNINDIIL